MSIETFEVPGLPLPVALKRIGNARRLRLRVDHGRRVIRLTLPVRASARAALRWAGQQRSWVEHQLAAAPATAPFADAAIIPFRGGQLRIRRVDECRRQVRLDGSDLLVGGPPESLPRSVERWLRDHARELLSEETTRIAEVAGVVVTAVSVGDPASRWGSCSASGAIRYSWRLVLAPPEALRFVVAHEVAHRLHMDHSPAFKRAEERLFGGPVASARALLREAGPRIRGVGRN